LISNIYQKILHIIEAKLDGGGISDIDASHFGEAFSYQFNSEILKLNITGTDKEFCNHNELFLSQIEKNRNKFILEFKCSSTNILFTILKSLIVIAEQNKDLRFLNIALKILDKYKNQKWLTEDTMQICLSLEKWIKEACLELISIAKEQFALTGTIELKRNFTKRVLHQPNKLNIDMVNNTTAKVIVFSPNPYSLYTLAVLNLLEKHGLKVEAVIVRRIFNIGRIRKEFARDGKRLIKKIIRKLIFRDTKRTTENPRNLSDVKTELNINSNSVIDWCKQFSIPLIKCNTINDQEVIEFLRIVKADYGVFTGGGIVVSDVLRQFSQGILNCHAGILPHYRGMDVIEWPSLQGDKRNTGATVHFMSEEVDEGELLYSYRMERDLNVISTRMEIESFAPYLQVKSLVDHISKKIKKEPQKLKDGRNYYVMHPWLFSQSVNTPHHI